MPQIKKQEIPAFNSQDLITDDKAALITMLVKKNIENDHLRREIEFLRQRTEGRWPDMTKAYPSSGENPKATEVLRAIGEVFSKYQQSAPELEQEGISVRNSAYKLASKMEQSQRQPHLDASFGNSDIPTAIKNLNFGNSTPDSWQQDRNKLLMEIEYVLRRISDPLRQSADFAGRSSSISPFKDSHHQYPDGEEYRTEIINGVPTRVKVPKRNVENVTNIRTFHLESPSRQPNELSAALRKISDLEAENQILQSRLDMQGGRGMPREMSDMTTSLIQRDLQDWRTKAIEAEADRQSALRELEMEHARFNTAVEERDELQKKIKSLSKKIDDLKEELEAANRKVKETEHKSNVDNRQSYDIRGQLDAKNREIDSLREDLNTKKGQLAEAEGKYKALFDENLEAKQKLRISEADYETKRRSAAELADKLSVAERAIYMHKETEHKLNDDLSEMDSTLAILKDKLEAKQSSLEASVKREKELTNALNDLKRENRELYEDINSNKGLLSKNETEALKQTQMHRDIYRNAIKKKALQLGQLKQKVHEINLDIKEARLLASREMIDCRRTMQAIKNLLHSKGEFCPKGTLQALVEMKEKHNEEIPRLMVKLASYEDIINRRDSQHSSNITLRNQEIESLERQLQMIRDEKNRVEVNRMSEQAQIEDQLHKYKSQLKLIERENDNAVEENIKFKKENQRKDREIADMKEDLESKDARIEELRKTNKKLQSKIDEVEDQVKKETPTKTQELTIRSIEEDTRQSPSHKAPRLTAAPTEGDCPAHVDIYIDASDKKNHRYTIETRPSVDQMTRKEYTAESQAEIDDLQKQLVRAYDRINQCERQLQTSQSKGKQQQEFEARMGELDSKLSELQVLIQLKDEEIDRLNKQLAVSRPGSTNSIGEDSDRVEVLRQRTEAMLAKVDKKLALASAKKNQINKSNVEFLAYEVDTLKRRLQDASKRYVNEYISVCQRSLDIYEQL